MTIGKFLKHIYPSDYYTFKHSFPELREEFSQPLSELRIGILFDFAFWVDEEPTEILKKADEAMKAEEIAYKQTALDS